MAELYWLALLLTGDRAQGVQAFSDALHLDQAFEEPTLSRARKLVAVAALNRIASQLQGSRLETLQTINDPRGWEDMPWPAVENQQAMTRLDLENALLAVELFPRCALVLTIFEGLSARDASVLLGADEKLVKAAAGRGLMQLKRVVASGGGHSRGRNHHYRPEFLTNWQPNRMAESAGLPEAIGIAGRDPKRSITAVADAPAFS